MVMNLLELEDVHYRYPGADRWALAGASLAIPGGRRLALIGSNGSGKSTLILHCNGVLRPERGRVSALDPAAGGERLAPDVLQRWVGVVFQNPDDQLFSDSVAQDISFGPYNLGLPADEVRRRVEEAAGLCHVEHLLERPVHELSGGEKARVALAGVLAMEPRIVIVDEVLSSLDPWMRRQMFAILDGLAQRGGSVVIATHDWDMIRAWADAVVWIEQGKVEAMDTPRRLFHLPGRRELREVMPAPAGGAAGTALPEAIVLVFFGTTSDEGRLVYDLIELETRRRYPGREVLQAFTSQVVIRKLRERGIPASGLAEVFAELCRRGFGAAAVLPLLVAPGQEYERVKAASAQGGLATVCAAPLLATDEDLEAVVRAIEPEVRDGMPNVIACHGNASRAAFNERLMALAEKIEARRDNVKVASVEGEHPGTAGLEQARLMARRSGAVHFIPLMLVAGDHVQSDIMGDEPASWKRRVAAPRATCSGPLGRNRRILEIFFQHLDSAIAAVGAAQGGLE